MPKLRPFANDSIFNAPLPDNTPLDVQSAPIVAALVAEAKSAALNTTTWSVPVYVVPASQALVKVTQIRPGSPSNAALQAAWSAVPLPADAIPAGPEGGDHHLVVWQPSTDKLWEFWKLEKSAEGSWVAMWGGAINGVSLSSGAYDSSAWPGAEAGWGASACSISIAAGLVTLDDLDDMVIDHALAMACPNTRAGVWCPPAKRTDGLSTGASSIPEGARFRLDPNLDLRSLELPLFTFMLAEAAQNYGIVVRDSSSAVPFYCEDPSRLIAEGKPNPYTQSGGYFDGETPSQLLSVFPWQHLGLLEMDLA